MKRFGSLLITLLTFALMATPAAAQSINIDLGEEGALTGRIIQIIALLTVLSLAPAILVVVTSFTRIVIVLSLLRSAMGVQTTPPNVVLISLEGRLFFLLREVYSLCLSFCNTRH